MPPRDDEHLQNQIPIQKDRQIQVFTYEAGQNAQVNLDVFKNGEVSIDNSFIRTQTRSQKDFYNYYEHKWNREPEGFLIAPPEQFEAPEVELQEIKLGYRARKQRTIDTDNAYVFYSLKMQSYVAQNADELEVNRNQTVYGLRLINTLAEDERQKAIEKLRKKDPVATYRDTYQQGPYTKELLKSTLNLASKDHIKRETVKSLMTTEKYDPLFDDYLDHFIALAPQLTLARNAADDGGGDAEATQASLSAFTAFIKKAMKDPIGTMKEAASDALYSFRQIPDKLLDKKAMPQKFDEVKELRDRYKAITDLFEGGYSDEMGKAFAELKKNKEEAPEDNIIFAKGLYQRIDADMRYCLEKNKLKFDESGLLVDRREVKNAHIKVDGNQSASLLRAVKKNATKDKRADVERYWDNKSRQLLLGDSKKEIKADKDFDDKYKIAAAFANVEHTQRTKVKGKENKGLFDDLKDRGDQIALAIAEIDKELEKSQTVFTDKADEFKARPQAKLQLERFIEKRKRQQVELMDRAAGVLNAMKYLASGADLTANGRQVLDDVKEIRSKVTYVTRDKNGIITSVSDSEHIDHLEEDEIFGKNASVAELAKSPLSFKDAKSKLLDKFKSAPGNRLVNLLNLDYAEFVYNMLLLDKVDLFSMDYDPLCNKIAEVNIAQGYTEKIRETIKQTGVLADRLYEELSNKEFGVMSAYELSEHVKDYLELKTKIYSLNKLKKIKPPGVDLTVDALLKLHRLEEDNIKDKNNELITNLKFKLISDNFEAFRCNSIITRIEAGDSPSQLCSKAEASKMKKLSAAEQMEYFKNKSLAADRLVGKHFAELTQAATNDQAIMNLMNLRYDQTELRTYNEPEPIAEEEYTKEQRKERRNKKDTIILNNQVEERQTEEQKKRNRNYILRNKYVAQYGQRFVTTMEDKPVYIPPFAPNCLGSFASEASKFLLSDDFSVFKQFADEIDLAFQQEKEPKTEDEKVLVDAYKTAYKNLASNDFVDKIIKQMVPEKALKNADVNKIELRVSDRDDHYKWLMSQISFIRNANDLKNLRDAWKIRNDYFKGVYGSGIDTVLYTKANVLLTSLADVIEKKERAAKVQKNVDGISGYKTSVKKEEQEKTYNLKDNDKEGIYKFDQHQKGSYGCWAASHTYVMNAYMKAHNIKGTKFTQSKFKKEENFIPNEKALKYIEDQSDNNANSMSFNQEAKNIQEFLAKDRTGNPYITADTVINALPKTAEHHLVFTNFYLNVMDEKKEDVKAKLTDYIMDKIQGELDRTKTPISLLKSGHYLSVVGVNRATKELITMDSLKSGDKLEEPTIVKISDLVEIDKFELVYPENLEDQNLKYLTDKFGLKKDLYDEKGMMKMDEEVKKTEDESLEKPQNMLHVNGVEFERKTRDFDFEENFVSEQIYMPKDLKLKKEETK